MKISVLIACYNVARWIRPCVDSLLAQQGDFTLEIIAVDDCSSDDTPRILPEYQSKGVRTIRHEHNMGLSATRNTGLEALTGDCFFLIDGDDYLPPGALARLAREFSDDVDWVQGGYSLVDEEGNELEKRNHPDAIYRSHEDIVEHFDDIEFITAHNRLTHKRLKDALYPVGKAPHENVSWNVDVFPRLNKLINVSDTTYCYVQRSGSICHTRRNSPKWADELLELFPRMQACLKHGWSSQQFSAYLLYTEYLIYHNTHPDITAAYRRKARKQLKPYLSHVEDMSYRPRAQRFRHRLIVSSLPDCLIFPLIRLSQKAYEILEAYRRRKRLRP